MRNALGAVAGLLLASAAATPALAQNMADTRASTFSIGGGVAFPLGDALDQANNGWIATGALTLRPTAIPVALRIEALYARFGFDQISVTDPGGSFTADVTTGIFGGTVNAVAGPSQGTVRPYFIGGVGIYNVNVDSDIDITGGGQSGSFSLSEDETAFGLNAGGGVDFMLGPLRSFIEARYHYILTDFADDETGEEGNRTSFIPIVIGLRF